MNRGTGDCTTMVWEFSCPVNECDFSASGNDQRQIIENAQQHNRDKHGDMPTREEVEEHIVGPG